MSDRLQSIAEDYVGTNDEQETGARKHLSFGKARAFVRRLGLRGQVEWKNYCAGRLPKQKAKPSDIPAAPSQVYKDQGWISWGDWLGTGAVAPQCRQYLPFEKAREFARGLRLRGQVEWKDYCKGRLSEHKPKDVPATPNCIYKDRGWISWGDWLGTGVVAPQLRQYRPFEEARTFSRQLGLRSGGEWSKYCKGELPGENSKPDDIPANPHHIYWNQGWISA